MRCVERARTADGSEPWIDRALRDLGLPQFDTIAARKESSQIGFEGFRGCGQRSSAPWMCSSGKRSNAELSSTDTSQIPTFKPLAEKPFPGGEPYRIHISRTAYDTVGNTPMMNLPTMR